MSTNAKVYQRWLIRRDMPAVMAIEFESFEFPWEEEDFVRMLRQRNCIGEVAEIGDRVVGYIVYEVFKTKIRILNLAVAGDERRQGVARAMVEKRIDCLPTAKRNCITLEVRETNLTAQKFFRALGFKCTNVLRDFYSDTDEDAYLFHYERSQ